MDYVLSEIRKQLTKIVRCEKNHQHSPRFDTSDVVQDSLIQVSNEIDNKAPTQVPRAWLQRIAIGHLAKHLRYHHAQKRSANRECRKSEIVECQSAGADPLDAIEQHENIERMITAIGKLDATARQIVLMRYFEGASYESIAQQLGLTVHRVRTDLINSLKSIRFDIGNNS